MRKIRNFIIIVITVLTAFILQSSVFSCLPVSISTPNLVLIVTVGYSLLLGHRKGMFIGLLCGLLCDIFFGRVIGFNALLYAMCGFVCGKFQHLMYVEDVVFPSAVIAVSDFIYCFLSYVFLFLVHNRIFFPYFFLHIILPEMIYTIVCTIPIYPILLWEYHKFLRQIRESEKLKSTLDHTIS